jgi:hypothetical protein
MNKSLVGLVLTFSILFCTVAIAAEWQEPEDFRGIKWGWTYQDIRANLSIATTQMASDPMRFGARIQRRLALRQGIGNMPVDFAYGFLDEGFASVNIWVEQKGQ